MKTEHILLAISAATGVGLLAWTIKQGPVAASIPTQDGGQQNFPFPGYTQPSPVNTAAQFSPLVVPSIAPPQPVIAASPGPVYTTFNFPSDSKLQLPAVPGDPYSGNTVENLLNGGNPPASGDDDHSCGCSGGCSCQSSQPQMSLGIGKLLTMLKSADPQWTDKYADNTSSSGLALVTVSRNFIDLDAA